MDTFDIFTQGIQQRARNPKTALTQHGWIFANFIAFRIEIYCDECHDFLGERAKDKGTDDAEHLEFSLTRYQQLLIDIIHYKTRYNFENKNPANPSDQLPFETYTNINDCLNLLPDNIDIYSFLYRITEFDCYHFSVSRANEHTFTTEMVTKQDKNGKPITKTQYKFSNGTIPMLFHLLDFSRRKKIKTWPVDKTILAKDINYDDNLRQKRTKDFIIFPYITTENKSKQITEYLTQTFFGLQSIPFSEILGCAYTYNVYDATRYVYHLAHDRMVDPGTNLAINIDATQSGTNLVPIYNLLFKEKQKQKCSKYELYQSIIDLKNTTRHLITPANRYDSSNDGSIATTMEEIGVHQSDYNSNNYINQWITLTFSGIPIIQFKFIQEPEEPIKLSINQYFGDNSQHTISRQDASVSRIATENKRLNFVLTKYKTMGDFLQIILYKLWADTHSSAGMSMFITMDIICGEIASLITPYVIAELTRPNDHFGGLSIYVNEIEKDRLLKDITQEQQILMDATTNLSNNELLGIKDQMAETLTDQELQDFHDEIIKENMDPEEAYEYYKDKLIPKSELRFDEQDIIQLIELSEKDDDIDLLMRTLKNTTDPDLQRQLYTEIKKNIEKGDSSANEFLSNPKNNEDIRQLGQFADFIKDTQFVQFLGKLLASRGVTSFGKYKKSAKKSTRKSTRKSTSKSTSKSTRKQSPKKSTRRQSPKKSTRKQSPNKTTKKQKYSEKVIKLSKKYNIKLDKNVVKNLKKLLSLQKKAKKLKLTITKKNSKGKRVYKTINELTKEIIKSKSKSTKESTKSKSTKSKSTKSKSTKSKSTKSKSTKKKVTKQIVAVREKAKKLKIKLTKRTSTGKRLYKTNNELMKEIKRKTK